MYSYRIDGMFFPHLFYRCPWLQEEKNVIGCVKVIECQLAKEGFVTLKTNTMASTFFPRFCFCCGAGVSQSRQFCIEAIQSFYLEKPW